jgi:hypothetical protein
MLRKIVTLSAGVLLAAQLSVTNSGSQEEPGKIGILLAVGDISWCPGKGTTHAAEIAEIIRGVMKEAAEADGANGSNEPVPVRVLALGDLAYRDGTTSEMKCFANNWKGLEDVLLPVPGNHEYESTNAEPFFDHFSDNEFVHQNDNPDDPKNPRWDKKGYFALNFPQADGPWRIIGLNDNFQARDSKGKEIYPGEMDKQLTWLASQIDMTKGNDQRCVLAFWHAPLFSSGRHGHTPYAHPKKDSPLTKARSMQTAFRMLHDHGASVVLAGHDHDYEQFGPHDADGNAVPDGIRSFVVGTGSNLTEDFYELLAATSEGGPYGKDNGRQGILQIDLYEDGYRWNFLQIGPKEKMKVIPMGAAKGTCNQRK